jgi:hypothetical protein
MDTTDILLVIGLVSALAAIVIMTEWKDDD